MGRMAGAVVPVYRDASRRTGLTFVVIDESVASNVVTFV